MHATEEVHKATEFRYHTPTSQPYRTQQKYVMYEFVTINNGARSRKHCCRDMAINITYSERVFVALLIQHAKRMRRIHLL
jgi:hypothetical protein